MNKICNKRSYLIHVKADTIATLQFKVIKSNPNVGSLRCGDDSGHVHIDRVVVRVVGRGHCARGNVTGRRRRDSCPGQLEPFVTIIITITVEIDINPVNS